MFKCEKCGACCCNIKKNHLYNELDNGNGVCIYYDINNKLCSIYNERPILCRIDEAYDLYFKTSMNKEEYYKLNYEACNDLRRLNKGE